MKKKCVSCGAKIEINSNFCTVCGTNQTSDKHHKGVIAKWFSRFNTSKDTKAGNGYLTYAEDGYPTYHFSKEQEEKYQNQQEEKEARKQQILTFKLEDMTQYEDLPFLWNKDLLYSYNKDQAYMRLWQENQDIACMYVDQIAKLIYDATDYIPDIKHCIIDPAQIDFNYRRLTIHILCRIHIWNVFHLPKQVKNLNIPLYCILGKAQKCLMVLAKWRNIWELSKSYKTVKLAQQRSFLLTIIVNSVFPYMVYLWL